MHQKKDPCNTCLVKACCSMPCDEKYQYTTDCISALTEFYKKHDIYKEGMPPKADIFLDQKLNIEKRRLEKICIKNNKDIIDTSIRRGIK